MSLAAIISDLQAAEVKAQAIGTLPSPPPVGTGVLATLAPNTARNLGSYINPHPDWVSKGRWITDDSGTVFDFARKRLLIFGGSHGPSQETDVRALDTMTGQWSSLYPSTLWADMLLANLDKVKGRWINTNQPVARHTYGHQVIRGDRYYLMAVYCNPDNLPEGTLPSFTSRICWYDLTGAGGWTYSNVSPPWYHANGSCLDPVSQNIYVVGMGPQASPGRIWKYDPLADTVTTGPVVNVNSQPVDLVYCPPQDAFYAFEKNGVVLSISIDRANINASTSTLLPTTGPVPIGARPAGYPSMSWDGARFGGCFINSMFHTFDPTTLTWAVTPVLIESGSTGPAEVAFNCSEWDASSGCYIFLQTTQQIARTWAYRP